MGNNISLYSNIYMSGGSSHNSNTDPNEHLNEGVDEGFDDSTHEEQLITLYDSLDFIASYYILTMDFQGLSQMHEKKYCEELTVLTSDIINKYFSDLEVSKVMQRVDSGSTDARSKEKLVFFNPKNINSLGVPDAETKKMYCNEIAKFYIKIAHVFSAIVTTINPEYTYKDMFGNTVKRSLMQKASIPADADVTVSKINLCSERIDTLTGSGEQDGGEEDRNKEEDRDEEEGMEEEDDGEEHVGEEREREGEKEKDASKTIKVNPDICSIHMDAQGETMYLSEEPGIAELIDLYYDSDYDYKTGKFLGMTPETETQFREDLKRFYTTFTDESDMPDDIKTFSDIKMRDYSKKPFCKKEAITSYTGNYKDTLFVDYANHLKDMIASVHKKQEELLVILNKLFAYVVDPVTQKDVIRVQPELTQEELQNIVIQTRSVIIELYLQCETQFVEGVKLYEAIVEGQMFETTQKHIIQLEKEHEKLIAPYTKPIASNISLNQIPING